MTCLALAQTAAQSFMWGVTAGANITKTDGEGKGLLNTGWDTDTQGGYWLGVQIRLGLPMSGFGLDASLNYSQEVATVSTGNESLVITASDKLRYFTIPLHLRYDLELPGISEVLIPFAFAGPQVNFALNDFDWYSVARQAPDAIKDTEKKEEVQYETSKQTWKIDLGFGVLLLGHVQLAYNYAIPLNDTFKFKTAYEDGKNNFKLGTHRIGLTYYF